MEKDWVNLPRSSNEYNNGVEKFLDLAFSKTSQYGQILCPCKECVNRHWLSRKQVYDHLIYKGFTRGYKDWVFHGEGVAFVDAHGDMDEIELSSHDNI